MQAVMLSDGIHERMWKVIQQACFGSAPAHGADAMPEGLVMHRRSSGNECWLLESRCRIRLSGCCCLARFVAISAVGLAGGLGNHRGMPARVIVSVLICGTIYVVLDLDKPHQGSFRLSQTPILVFSRF